MQLIAIKIQNGWWQLSTSRRPLQTCSGPLVVGRRVLDFIGVAQVAEQPSQGPQTEQAKDACQHFETDEMAKGAGNGSITRVLGHFVQQQGLDDETHGKCKAFAE